MRYLPFVLALLLFLSCSNDSEKPEDITDYSFELMQPRSGETISNSVNFIIISKFSRPDYIDFYVDTFICREYGFDYDYPISKSIDITGFPDGSYNVACSLRWADTKIGIKRAIRISKYNCSDSPIILNGSRIPEDRIERDRADCPKAIWLNDMAIDDAECLENIESYANTVEEIYLFHNDLTEINLEHLITCRNLRKLHLWGNRLTEIDLSPLSHLMQLEELDLGGHNNDLYTRLPFGNKLSSISLAPLASCANLRFLDLSYNKLSSINLNPLANNHLIGELYLSDNELIEIDLDALENHHSISILDLSNNLLRNLSLDALENKSHLRILLLENNQLADIDLNQLSNCKGLETINLSQNPLHEIDEIFLRGSQSIKNLLLSDCQLDEFDMGELVNCPALMKIDLSDNNLCDIDLSHLSNKRHLYWLDFSYNDFTNFNVLPLFSSERDQIFIFVQGNDLADASCIYLCDFANMGQNEVISDCNCQGNLLKVNPSIAHVKY